MFVRCLPICSAVFIYTFLLFLPTYSDAQIAIPKKCGHQTSQLEIEKLLKNKKNALLNIQRSGATNYIPIQFHLVAKDAGIGRIPESQVFEGLCKLNEDFAETGMQFYFNGSFNYIDKTILYDLTYPEVPSAATIIYFTNKVQGAINMFIGNGLSSGNSGYYTSSQDIIYMDRDYVSDDDNIMAHEVGHFLSLPHTFLGWENTTYNPSQTTPTQVFNGSTAYNVEYVDRNENCATSGDFFCDTPADYITDWNGGCNYTGGAVDPNGIAIDPDEMNIMAYYSFAGCNDYHFSNGQSAAMLADYQSRLTLVANDIEMQDPVAEAAVILSPEEDEEVPFEAVTLSWESAPGATMYLVEISRLSNFFVRDDYAVVTDLEYTSLTLANNRTYYWRVRAINETNSCDQKVSTEQSFKTRDIMTGSRLPPFENLTLKVAPNPIKMSNGSVGLQTSTSLDDITINIIDVSGKQVLQEKNVNLNPGQNDIILPASLSLQTGVYFIRISNDRGSNTLKMLVQ